MKNSTKYIGGVILICGFVVGLLLGIRHCERQAEQDTALSIPAVAPVVVPEPETETETTTPSPIPPKTQPEIPAPTTPSAKKKHRSPAVTSSAATQPAIEKEDTLQTPSAPKEEAPVEIVEPPEGKWHKAELVEEEAPVEDSLTTTKAAIRKRGKILGVGLPQAKKRMERGIENHLFVPKGVWSGGINFSYTEHTNDNYEFLVVKNWDGIGYRMQFSPYVSYFYKDNRAIGLRLTYRRNLLKIDNISLDLGDDLSFSLKDQYSLEQVYSGTVFHRAYVGLGKSKRFGLFNETRFTIGGGQGKFVSGKDEFVRGTYQDVFEFEVGFKPGLCVFILNNVATEVAIGVVGFKYRRVDQIFNQVHVGTRSTSAANFKIDPFSISFGMSVYL